MFGCNKEKAHSFYYWKTIYQLNAFEQKYLDSLDVKKLYVRFFDVDLKNGKPAPIGKLTVLEQNKNQEIVPVIFITNETFNDLDKKEIEALAHYIQKEIQFIYPKIANKKIKEVQFDCDWTVRTRNRYFYFLNVVEKQNPSWLVSATIRLHQIKDKEKTGVPPINKGVLMYYATSNPLDFTDNNSILNNTLANNYIRDLNRYPIKIDVALPIYSWEIIQNPLV